MPIYDRSQYPDNLPSLTGSRLLGPAVQPVLHQKPAPLFPALNRYMQNAVAAKMPMPARPEPPRPRVTAPVASPLPANSGLTSGIGRAPAYQGMYEYGGFNPQPLPQNAFGSRSAPGIGAGPIPAARWNAGGTARAAQLPDRPMMPAHTPGQVLASKKGAAPQPKERPKPQGRKSAAPARPSLALESALGSYAGVTPASEANLPTEMNFNPPEGALPNAVQATTEQGYIEQDGQRIYIPDSKAWDGKGSSPEAIAENERMQAGGFAPSAPLRESGYMGSQQEWEDNQRIAKYQGLGMGARSAVNAAMLEPYRNETDRMRMLNENAHQQRSDYTGQFGAEANARHLDTLNFIANSKLPLEMKQMLADEYLTRMRGAREEAETREVHPNAVSTRQLQGEQSRHYGALTETENALRDPRVRLTNSEADYKGLEAKNYLANREQQNRLKAAEVGYGLGVKMHPEDEEKAMDFGGSATSNIYGAADTGNQWIPGTEGTPETKGFLGFGKKPAIPGTPGRWAAKGQQAGIPAGAKQVGTSGGRPVYEINGQRFIEG